MSTRTIIFRVCDSCFRNDREPNPIEIISTTTLTQFCGPTRTIDICSDCDAAEKYYCRFCDQVHTDDNPCEGQLREIEEAEAYWKEMTCESYD